MDTKQGRRTAIHLGGSGGDAAARLGERRVRGRRSSCERCRRKAGTERARGRCPLASGGGSKHRLWRGGRIPQAAVRARGERGAGLEWVWEGREKGKAGSASALIGEGNERGRLPGGQWSFNGHEAGRWNAIKGEVLIRAKRKGIDGGEKKPMFQCTWIEGFEGGEGAGGGENGRPAQL
jgi:hypothetical protein